MKKALTRTIIVFIILTLITAGFAFAQDVPEENVKEAKKEALKQAEAARREATIPLDLARKEVDVARRQLEVTRRQMGATQKQMAIAQEHASHDMLLDTLEAQVSMPLWQHSSSGAVLVIPAAQMKLEDLATITEDMNVMSRIFAKKLSQARLTTRRGSWYVEDYNPFLGRDSGTTEAIYLEGYAALFLMKVNFPLSPLPEEKEEKETKEEDTDPLWTQMRQEIYAPEEIDRRRRPDDRPEEKYDAEKVEELKETLTKTLKHAANLRALKPDQSVILTVIGKASQSTTDVTRSYSYSSRSRGRSSSRGSSMVRRAPGNETGSFLPTVLTICAKKSDIDAFAKGELNYDQFRQRTGIFTSYAKVGQGGFPGVGNRPSAQAQSPIF